MNLNEAWLAELKHEARGTRKMIERAPEESNNWKPHQRSMSLGRLVTYLAGLTKWLSKNLISENLV